MKVIDLFESARPLRWENDDPDFEYSIGGTGFLGRYRGRHFLLTARHCLQNRDVNSLRVEIRKDSNVFNALKQIHKIEGEERWHDLAFFEFDSTQTSPAELTSPDFLDLDYLSTLDHSLLIGATFAFRGYPTELNVPDYEKKILKQTSVTMGGRWAGEWIKPHCGAFKIVDDIRTCGIEDTDGVSGSAVFMLVQTSAGTFYRFAGVVVWGCGHVLRFIEAPVVFVALKQICKAPAPGPGALPSAATNARQT